jgi:hypothetical protein
MKRNTLFAAMEDVNDGEDVVVEDYPEGLDIEFELDTQLEPLLSDEAEIHEHLAMIDDATENLTSLESLYGSISVESLANPHVASIVNISIEALCNKLGLEDSAMQFHHLGVGYDEKTKEHGESKIKAMFVKVWEWMKKIWGKIVEFFHNKFNILLANMDRIFTGIDSKIKKLPEGNAPCYDKHVEIKNEALARLFYLREGQPLDVHKAELSSNQIKYITEAIKKVFITGKTKGLFEPDSDFLEKIIEGLEANTVRQLVDPVRDMTFVGGVHIAATSNEGVEITHDKVVTHKDGFSLLTPANKQELVKINDDSKAHLKLLNAEFVTIQTVKLFVNQINKLDTSKFKPKDGNVPPAEAVEKFKKIMMASMRLFHYLYNLGIETYRAVIKYLVVTLKEMNTLNHKKA